MIAFKRFARTAKGTLLLIFVALLGVSGTATGWPAVAPHVAAAVLGACGVELAVFGALRKKLTWPTSALLSGLIVAFVLGTETPSLVTLAVAATATLSKYALTTDRGHIFNPAAIALTASVPIFATGQSWWGAGGDLAWPFLVLLIAGGALIVDRINKWPLVLAFLGTYLGLCTAMSFSDATAVAELFRAPFIQSALFLAVFMLTDPPTSPARLGDQVWIGALVGVVALVAQLLGVGQTYLLVATLVGNAALVLKREFTLKRVTGASRSVPV